MKLTKLLPLIYANARDHLLEIEHREINRMYHKYCQENTKRLKCDEEIIKLKDRIKQATDCLHGKLLKISDPPQWTYTLDRAYNEIRLVDRSSWPKGIKIYFEGAPDAFINLHFSPSIYMMENRDKIIYDFTRAKALELIDFVAGRRYTRIYD
jgi:hypothetical protein